MIRNKEIILIYESAYLLFGLVIELLFKAFLVFINTAYKRGPSVFAPGAQNFLCNQKCQLKELLLVIKSL